MADQYIQQVNTHLDQLDTQLRTNPYVHQAATSTGVRPSLIAAGIAGFFTLFTLVTFGAKFLANAVGFVYPLYASFKALKSPDNKDDAMWLTYWVVYGAFTVIESGTDVLLYWIPFYNFVKIGIFVYLYAPQTRGAQKIYSNLINPFLSRHEAEIDNSVNTARNFARQAEKEYMSGKSS